MFETNITGEIPVTVATLDVVLNLKGISMKRERLEEQLRETARRIPADESVPYAFEKRVMANLRDLSAPDIWGWWSRALWRASAPCLAVALGVVVWSLNAAPAQSASEPLADEFEYTLLSSINDSNLNW
jgi:hypothetical protein